MYNNNTRYYVTFPVSVSLLFYILLKMEWTKDDLIKLANVIKLYPVLWQPDHPQYGKKSPRDAAYRKVGKEFPGRGKHAYIAYLDISEDV